ncbi:MAG: hypothetical protein KKC50_03190 [Candidatus Omnitrophica bacterium]|nr:hypothetical protein [Candidatus Omnitrophota bacterium]MBU1127635.1 hypothetical protein [Candidatus Omnitrophota bacterium]
MNRDNSALKHVLANIDLARTNVASDRNTGIVVLVSGDEVSCDYWQRRLERTAYRVFNSGGGTVILSLQEKQDGKARTGNFLGTLLAYSRMKSAMGKIGVDYRNSVALMGMIFGRGERMSPFTQIEGNCKPAIAGAAANFDINGTKTPISEIEESLMFFSPVAKYLEARGFRGVLDKWGDETEIAAIDLGAVPDKGESLNAHDIIKFVSVFKITETLARSRDWVVHDGENNMLDQAARGEKEVLITRLKKLGIKPRTGKDAEEYYAGVSLGPVAVSYDVLDIAAEIFAEDIKRPGVCLDFDPYLLKAFAMRGDQAKWKTALKNDPALMILAGPAGMIPDLFDKARAVRESFKKKHGRELNLKTIDLGKDIFWMDIGQHDRLREKYMSLNARNEHGVIARKLEGIPDAPDGDGNIIINSAISHGISVKDSVIINSRAEGQGRIERSVIKDSFFRDIDMRDAFAVLSRRTGKTVLKKNSGIYRSIGSVFDTLVLEDGMRSGTLLTSYGPIDMRVSEHTDLGDRDNTYCAPIFGNKISFREAYDEMSGISFDELERRRKNLLAKVEGMDEGEW